MKVILRVDSSLSIGSGHIIRCLNLATALRKAGAKCCFVSKEHHGNVIDKIEQSGFQVIVTSTSNQSDDYIRDEKSWLNGIQSEDAEEFIILLKRHYTNPDIVIVDHYSLDHEWERIVKNHFSTTRLIAIDDLCNRPHFCDLLIDQTFRRDPYDYHGLNTNNAVILAGTEYALLDPKFSSLRKQSRIRKEAILEPKTLMVTMGGVDAFNVAGQVLEYLEVGIFNQVEKITIILGSACPHDAAIRSQASKSKYKVDVLTNVTNMAELMLEHDFAIGAMGGTTWERCVMALPAVNIAIADNQKTIAKNLSEVGAIVLSADSFNENDLITSLKKLMTYYHDQRLLAMDICDGQGLFRVVQEIMLVPAKDGVNITLRKATVEDIDFVYLLQCQPETRRYARNPDVPSYQQHTSWMQRKLDDDRVSFYIIEHDASCGVLRLEPVEHPNADVEISIFLTVDCHGKGIASAAIKRALMLNDDVNILATVLPENHASHQLFGRIGFAKVSSSEYISEKKK